MFHQVLTTLVDAPNTSWNALTLDAHLFLSWLTGGAIPFPKGYGPGEAH